MKKLLVLLFVFVPAIMFGQRNKGTQPDTEAERKAANAEKLAHVFTPQTEVNFEYCEIIKKPKYATRKIAIQIDFGQQLNLLENTDLKDENGNSVEFYSMIEALNYMGTFGWEFVQAYVVVDGESSDVHYILKRRKINAPVAK
ncbi:MAG TPA: hypothetical protein VHO72_14265 [Bacteroidales bacterium]|nr:hypothetical protein [Bacteroidales bacterium]